MSCDTVDRSRHNAGLACLLVIEKRFEKSRKYRHATLPPASHAVAVREPLTCSNGVVFMLRFIASALEVMEE